MSESPLKLKPALHRKVEMARLQKIVTPETVRQSIDCLDLTSLTGSETEHDIQALCDTAIIHRTASVCVYPEHVSLAAQFLKGTGVKVATVINFPSGKMRTNSDEIATTKSTASDVKSAIRHGAGQVDIVYPRADIAGFALDMIKSAREAAGSHVTLKSIMETAAFYRTEDLEDAVLIALNGGVDCIKTSTGKHENGGATLEAAAVILDTIRRSKREVGIKISGGLRTAEQCAQYIALTQIFSGRNGARPQSFRFGGSGILSELVSALPSSASSAVAKGNDIAPAY